MEKGEGEEGMRASQRPANEELDPEGWNLKYLQPWLHHTV